MTPQELLFWVRGTGLQIAAAVVMFGMSYRMLHLALLGRKKILADPRGSEWWPRIRTMWRRAFVLPGLSAQQVYCGRRLRFSPAFFHHPFFSRQHIELLCAIFGFGCRNVLQGGFKHNLMTTSVVGLTELIAEHLAPAAK